MDAAQDARVAVRAGSHEEDVRRDHQRAAGRVVVAQDHRPARAVGVGNLVDRIRPGARDRLPSRAVGGSAGRWGRGHVEVGAAQPSVLAAGMVGDVDPVALRLHNRDRDGRCHRVDTGVAVAGPAVDGRRV